MCSVFVTGIMTITKEMTQDSDKLEFLVQAKSGGDTKWTTLSVHGDGDTATRVVESLGGVPIGPPGYNTWVTEREMFRTYVRQVGGG